MDQIHALFPPERHRVVEQWADAVKPDSASTYEMIVEHLHGLPLERRLSLYESLSAMAEADGKATKSEETRLSKLRQDLGLNSAAEDAP